MALIEFLLMEGPHLMHDCQNQTLLLLFAVAEA